MNLTPLDEGRVPEGRAHRLVQGLRAIEDHSGLVTTRVSRAVRSRRLQISTATGTSPFRFEPIENPLAPKVLPMSSE